MLLIKAFWLLVNNDLRITARVLMDKGAVEVLGAGPLRKEMGGLLEILPW